MSQMAPFTDARGGYILISRPPSPRAPMAAVARRSISACAIVGKLSLDDTCGRRARTGSQVDAAGSPTVRSRMHAASEVSAVARLPTVLQNASKAPASPTTRVCCYARDTSSKAQSGRGVARADRRRQRTINNDRVGITRVRPAQGDVITTWRKPMAPGVLQAAPRPTSLGSPHRHHKRRGGATGTTTIVPRKDPSSSRVGRVDGEPHR
jgi:hypothetical protein